MNVLKIPTKDDAVMFGDESGRIGKLNTERK